MDDDDDYDDELPTIIVNASHQNEDQFIMPSAEVLASERAREEECEREIEQLRCEHEAAARLAHSDSSSSESEVLSAAVDALRVQAAQPPGLTRPCPARLLADLLRHMRPEHTLFIRDYLEMIQQADPNIIDDITYDVTSSILWSLSTAGTEKGMWGEAETLGVGSWLCAACVWGANPHAPPPGLQPPHTPRGTRARIRRALHCLLDVADTQHVRKLAHVMECTLTEPLMRLELAEAAGGAGGTFAAQLLHAALRDLLAPTAKENSQASAISPSELAELVRMRWRSLSADERHAVVQLTGRSLLHPLASGALDSTTTRHLLAEITQPGSVPLADRHRPDHLKVLVAASKLQLLFRDKRQD
ncbi:uncharacterized protein LOC113514388 [Galleria mellonella]|uniref:Uncharacterized protein LOC113514388 n=1 Tax=Galleria mellonella TaxID=7137 RepID=A0ABM3MDF0_GALME|nr:uncharacterized protein LOC113514388 [Galleria mellonella]